MEWNTQPKNKTDLFTMFVATPNVGDEWFVNVSGESVGDCIRVPHIPLVVTGETYVYYSGFDPKISNEFNCHYWRTENEKQYAPAGLASMVAKENLTYMCITASKDKKLDYDYFFGPHPTYTTTHNNTYLVVARGTAAFNGEPMIQYDVIKKTLPGQIVLSDISSDSIILYVWER